MSTPDESANAELSLEQQLTLARRACTFKERKWLSKLQDHDFSPWRTAKALGISKRTAWLYLRRPRIQKAMELMDQLDALRLGLTRTSVMLRYLRIADANLKRFYNKDGTLQSPTQWDEDDAAAVQEYYFDDNGNPRIKLRDSKAANDALARIVKLLGTERLELTGANGGPIETKRHVDELSDAELDAIARRGQRVPAEPPEVSALSDEQLEAIARGGGATPTESTEGADQ